MRLNVIDCETCRLIRRRDAPDAPLWDTIYRSDFFDVAHVFNTSLPGWIVVVAKRHIAAIDELTVDESIELGMLLRNISIGLKEAVSCSKTYVMQFVEQPGHSHVHFHVVPRSQDLPKQHRSANVFSYLGVDNEQRVSDSLVNEISSILQNVLFHT